MEEKVLEFMSRYITLTKEEERIILDLNLIRYYKKGTVLLKEGEIARYNYLVLSGCVRSYYLINGEEKTSEFYMEFEPVTSVSLAKKTPSEYYIDCLEDSVLGVETEAVEKSIFQQIPRLSDLAHSIKNEMLAEQQVRYDQFKNLSAEDRYLKLLEARPKLVQRVPQYHLASYLGIKPESLSRIRKRLADREKQANSSE